MLESLKVEGTRDTPEIIFDPENNRFEISGNSLPENYAEFFNPLFSWIDEYIKQPNKDTLLKCNLEYFNSSSAKMLYQLFIELERIKDTGNNIQIHWYYEQGDNLIEEKGLEYQSILDIPFEMKEINP